MAPIDDQEEPALSDSKDLGTIEKSDDPDQVDVEEFILEVTITVRNDK